VEQLTDDPSAAGAERRAHGDFLLARQRAGQQEVRDIRACDQQHEADRSQEHQQGTRRTLPTTWSSSGTMPNVRPPLGGYSAGKSRRKPGGDGVHLGSRPRHGDARLELRDDVVVLVVAIGRGARRQRQRQEDLAVFRHTKRRQHFARQRERVGKDADHLVTLSVQVQGPSDDARVATVSARPCAVAQDGRVVPRGILVGDEEAACRGLHAEHRQ